MVVYSRQNTVQNLSRNHTNLWPPIAETAGEGGGAEEYKAVTEDEYNENDIEGRSPLAV